VLYRLFVDEWRRRRSTPEIDASVEPDDGAGDEVQPEDAFEQGLTRTRLQRALDRLPAFQREIIIMHDVEGYTLVEVAEITGTPTGTLKSRLHRGRGTMRADLAGD
jgi:RNA polymerase sigma-70 factor (ECF subfamily)